MGAQVATSRRPRRLLLRPLFGLALLPLAGEWAAARAAELPIGGTVMAGAATIGIPSANALTVIQSSSKAIIDWAGFSIGDGGSVRFDNGAGATLNRVTGGSRSAIDGLLSASGSVYLLNPNGVIVGTSGVVDVGGSFVASTLDIDDAAFLSGGDLAFAGGSGASVINLGRIGALGGDVALIARTVANEGTVAAANGTAGLAAGGMVLLRDAALGDGRFLVQIGGADTSVTNSGAIVAAAAELRANGGNVYALAGNSGGAIRADGVSARDGRIYLTAGEGSVVAQGEIRARGLGGTGGFIETSAAKIDFAGATIDPGAGGAWLVDPTDLLIDQGAANTIAATLNTGAAVTQTTSAAGTGGSGDINVAANVNLVWDTAAALTLSAYRFVSVGNGAKLSSTGGGAVTLRGDNTGTGVGGVSFGSGAGVFTSGATEIFYNPSSYISPTNYAPYVTGGGALTAYMLVNTPDNLGAISRSAIGLQIPGAYALGRDIDLAGEYFAPIGTYNQNSILQAPFAGTFDGQGHSILNLNMNVTVQSASRDSYATEAVGLFAVIDSGGIVRNLNLVGGSITAAVGSYRNTPPSGLAGGISGANYGTISNVSSNLPVTVNGVSRVGGLVGANSGTITNGVSTGSVIATTGSAPGSFGGSTVISAISAGGLAGDNSGTILNSYATASVSDVEGTNVGGFVGLNSGAIAGAYASGVVTGGTNTGGFVGVNASGGRITDGYWDEGTTGQLLGYATNDGSITRLVGLGGDTGLSAFAQSSYTHFSFDAGGTWFMIDGATRPFLRSEYSTTIANAHQLQLMALDLGASYRLAGDVDASGTGTGNDVWNPATGFAPVGPGSFSNAFTGSLVGAGHVIEGLTIRSTSGNTGLFGAIAPGGLVRDLTLGNGYISRTETPSGGAEGTGALVGYNRGSITNVTSNVTVFGTENNVGGLVGFNAGGSIFGARATGSTTGQFARTQTQAIGGLVGFNGGSIDSSSAGGIVATTVLPGTGQASPGGLVGYNLSSIRNSYATGDVTLVGQGTAGGLLGANGTNPFTPSSVATSYAAGRVFAGTKQGLVGTNGGAVTDSYYDIDTSGPSSSGTAVGASVNRSAYSAASYAGFDFSAAGPWFLIEGATRPILRSEYSTVIRDAHQLQLAALDPGASYVLANDINLGEVRSPAGIWNPATGFAPIGSDVAPFTGTFDGKSRSITALYIARGASDRIGLFGATSAASTITDLVLASGTVTGRSLVGALVGSGEGLIERVRSAVAVTGNGDSVGGIAGGNFGQGINDSIAGGTVTGGNVTGGLVGRNTAPIISSYGGGTVTGLDATGGLAGFNDVSGLIRDSSFAGAVVGRGYVGGVVGYNSGSLYRTQGRASVAGSQSQIGGLAGLSSGTIDSSSAVRYNLIDAVSGLAFVGGLVGTNSGSITNSDTNIDASGTTYVGGLAGKNEGAISVSFALGNVAATAEHAGGLVGLSVGTIARSYANGVVAGANFTGGLAGLNLGRITASYATGGVAGQDLVGGLVGLNDVAALVDNSAAFGPASGRGYVGGLAGYNSGVIDSTHAHGTVTATAGQAGGLVGFNGSIVDYSYATGTVTGQLFVGGLAGTNGGTILYSYAYGAADGEGYVGGLAGKNDGSVSDSYARGAVTARLDSAGGLIGSNNAGRLDRVFATGAVAGRNYVGGLLGYSATNVTGAYATGAVTGAYFVGGLAGAAAAGGSLNQVYAAGLVQGTSAVGGLVGDNVAVIANGYWDTSTTGLANAVGSGNGALQNVVAIGGSTGLNPSSQATYQGFNFADIWTIRQGQSRPYLQNVPQAPPPQ